MEPHVSLTCSEAPKRGATLGLSLRRLTFGQKISYQNEWMSEKDEDCRHETVEPCLGSGTMILLASNHALSRSLPAHLNVPRDTMSDRLTNIMTVECIVSPC